MYRQSESNQILLLAFCFSLFTHCCKDYENYSTILNKLDASTRNPQVLGSALASLRMLQPQAFGFLNHIALGLGV